jgi:hypothetical protein
MNGLKVLMAVAMLTLGLVGLASACPPVAIQSFGMAAPVAVQALGAPVCHVQAQAFAVAPQAVQVLAAPAVTYAAPAQAQAFAQAVAVVPQAVHVQALAAPRARLFGRRSVTRSFASTVTRN